MLMLSESYPTMFISSDEPYLGLGKPLAYIIRLNPSFFDSHDLPLNPSGKGLTETVVAYWTNFAKYGNPNSDAIPE
jgi:para-nitrobenzyl esterase